MKKISMSIMILLFAGYVQAQTTWVIDPVHSRVNFTVDHLVISEVDGVFKTFSGSLTESKSGLENASINFKIDATSISTDNEKRDGHLMSEDFFYTERFPTINFKSTSFQKVSDKEYSVIGDLSMRGVTKSVMLVAKYSGQIEDNYGNTLRAFKVTGSLKRMDYGIAWNSKTEHGNLVVGDDVKIDIKLELVKQ